MSVSYISTLNYRSFSKFFNKFLFFDNHFLSQFIQFLDINFGWCFKYKIKEFITIIIVIYSYYNVKYKYKIVLILSYYYLLLS